jgi:hypothetical protein
MAPGGKAFIIFNFPPGVSFFAADGVGDLPRVKKALCREGGCFFPLGVCASLPLHLLQ